LATVPGLVGATTIDQCLARFDDALEMDELFVPDDAMDELRFECMRLGIDFASYFPPANG
jgi:hypothetical protein